MGADTQASAFIMCGGEESKTRMGVRLVSWRELARDCMPWQ